LYNLIYFDLFVAYRIVESGIQNVYRIGMVGFNLVYILYIEMYLIKYTFFEKYIPDYTQDFKIQYIFYIQD